jgi:integrase
MNIYKRNPKGCYWFRFEYKGQQIRRSTGVKNAEDAKDIAAAYRTKLARGEVGLEVEEQKTIPSFTEAMKEFLEWSEEQYAAHPNTHRRYVTSSKALLRFFKNTPLNKIDSDLVEKVKTTRAREKKAPQGKKSGKPSKATKRLRPATVNRELALLKHLFTRNETLIPQNPVKSVKFLEEDNEQLRVLTHDEEKLYLLAASQPLQDIACLMVETGMRPEEVYRIRRENVHIEQGYLFNPYGKTKAARRKVWLNDTALHVLSRRLEKIEGDYLFPGRVEGKPIVKVNNAHTATLKRCGVAHFTLYSLRHTWATRAAESGVDLVTLAAMLGHSKINMVLRYAHPTEQHQAAAMQKIQQRMAAR